MLAVDGDMPKDGSESVGVACQYCGQLGKRANFQAVVFVAYLGRGSAALVDRRLYLSQAWVSGESQVDRYMFGSGYGRWPADARAVRLRPGPSGARCEFAGSAAG